MKSTTRLDSVVFQLTPTRTRFDLVIIANGKAEKIASGLLNPFLAHLKTAQEQMAKGGYSITLEPNSGSDATWFSNGTVERFVRFVSNPEVLERVNTIESEILQIEEAIAIQGNENLELSTVEDHQTRSVESIEGSKPVHDVDAEKAIILYQPGSHPPESNGSTMQEENSKVKLLKVLETRKTVLQKEQGMAFARAVAAGFDMDHMSPLISFAECFGATRLMEACIRFMELWKEKHETGQWLEIEAAEAMSNRSDLSSMNTSGIMLPSEIKKQKEFSEAWPESRGELGLESNGKANGADADMSSHQNGDKKGHMDPQFPLGHHEYFQGQFQHPMFPQWPIHSPPGAPPVFQGYPMQGMPYYQSYPGNGPFFPPPYPPPVEDSRFNAAQRMGQKRHSMDSKDSNTESEREMGASYKQSPDGSELEKEGSRFREPRRKAGRSDKRQSGMVVIRNINYVTSNRQNSSESESNSASDPETDEEPEDVQIDAQDEKHKNRTRSSKSKGSHTKSNDTRDSYDKDETVYGQGADGGHWQAFQNCLLRDDNENTYVGNEGIFAMEKESKVRRRQNTVGDPIVPHGRDSREVQEGRMTEFDTISAKLSRMLKLENEELLLSKGQLPGGGTRDGQVDVQLTEIEGGRRPYRRTSDDDFMIYGRENHSGVTKSFSDPLTGNEFGHPANNSDRSSSHNVTDESFIVPLRANSADQVGTDSRMAMDIGSELPSALQKTENSSGRIMAQLSYEPDDLSLMPERGTERETIGYDPAVDYEMQVHTEDVTVKNRNKEENVTKVGSKKSDKDKNSKVIRDGLDKRKIEAAMRKGKPSKLSPLIEAQARAERLRSFKADLQKVKKEKEEEEAQRLEALKRERQKRIAARGSSGPVPSPLSSQQSRSRLPMKLSPSAQKSKFSDSDPAPASPLQRLPIRAASIGSSDSQKITKISRLNSGPLGGNGLSQSLSSLPEQKKEIDGITPESKTTTMRTRRLSDHKTSNGHHVSSVKSRSAEPVSKPKLSNGPEIKKISAIMSLDRTKAATLPELKIRTSKGPSVVDQNKSAAKEAKQKTNLNKSSVSSEDIKLRSNDKTVHSSSGDENPIIEKTVVMLEPEVPPISVAHSSEESMETKRGPYDEDKAGAKTEVVSEYAAIRAPVSPLNRDSSECHLDERPGFSEVTKDYGMEELTKVSSISIAENPYQVPYARASSLEDPCTTNLEFSKASATTSAMGAISTETTKAHVSGLTVLNSSGKNPEALEKPRNKESKGFKRLLMFGRKNHSSTAAECNMESDKYSVDGSEAEHDPSTAASDEANMLKNLISQDETPKAVTTPQKVSRPFSLLSPFRSKNSAKKLTT
ncbi:COP1-interacting protein 7-like [Telopea speciosissima]|uniref:COP1-interacting protein 7-like n=1 Tax=Telopea speciosissima TaxID=54955 RepID=UPI001CC65FD7|nr:COP1-interacting protein 7-like [Telopea speciosissima]